MNHEEARGGRGGRKQIPEGAPACLPLRVLVALAALGSDDLVPILGSATFTHQVTLGR